MGIDLRAIAEEQLPAATELLASACTFDRADLVAAEKLFGPSSVTPHCHTLGAFDDQHLLGLVVWSAKWLRLLAVSPHVRGRGIGSSLLAAAERSMSDQGHLVSRTLDQPGNYLAPGIDVRNSDSIAWLESRGYQRIGTNSNLLISLDGNDQVSPARAQSLAARAIDRGYQLRRARPDDAELLHHSISQNFSTGWAFEVGHALGSEPCGVHLAVDTGGQLAAFAAHGGNNHGLGWFGPAGTLKNSRGIGLGAALLMACLLDIQNGGHAQATIAWIGPREFYDKTAGVVGEHHFVVMEKSLTAEVSP